MKNKLFILICFLFINNLIIAQTSSDKAAAKDFGLRIIKSLFDKNCDFMFDHLDQTISSFEAGQKIIITEELRQVFCSENPLRTDIKVSYDLYKDNYAPIIYNKKELQQKFPEWANNLDMQANDYFFDGSNPIVAGNTRLFKTNSTARFVLRKKNKDWLIIAI